MRAVVQHSYGKAKDVLQVADVEVPECGENEVRVRVHAAAVHPDVWHAVRGLPYVLRLMGGGFAKPKNPIPGIDLAGVVDAVGKNVREFSVGDEVFGDACGNFQWKNGGTYAEYAVVPASSLEKKPVNVSFEQAAAVTTAGYIAMVNLRSAGETQPGQHVLVNGAGGNVGAAVLQLAKAAGAEVTGVDCSRKLPLIESLGCDHVIDFEKTSVYDSGGPYDVIVDVASTLTVKKCKPILSPEGAYVLIGHDHFGKTNTPWFGSMPRALGEVLLAPLSSHLRGMKHLKAAEAGAKLSVLRDLLLTGKLTPVIDRSFALEDVVEAMRYMEEGRAVGYIVLSPATPPESGPASGC